MNIEGVLPVDNGDASCYVVRKALGVGLVSAFVLAYDAIAMKFVDALRLAVCTCNQQLC